MSVSITLSDLAWSTPDGRPLLSGLDLSFDVGRFGLVGRNGAGKTTLLRLISGDLAPQSGSVSVNGTLGVLRQAVQVDPTETIADLFGMAAGLAPLRLAESGEASVDELALADWSLEARVASCLGRVGLGAPPATALATLSGGQRTRAGLAALIFTEPDFILLDEPTNNLDRDGRRAVIDLFHTWRKGAIVVSHDRELLETMDAIVELTSLGATRYGRNFSHYRERKAQALAAARHDLADAEKRVTDLAKRAQASVERKARKDRAGRTARKRGDIPRIQLNTMRSRSENTGGDNARLAERRRTQALDDAEAARKRIEVLQPFSVALASTGLPAGKTVLRMEAASVGYEPGRPVIRDLSFHHRTGAHCRHRPERFRQDDSPGAHYGAVAVLDGNGSGHDRLRPARPAGRPARSSCLDPGQFPAPHPNADENTCRAALARFMFRADAALQTVSSLSGAQVLRAGLACVLCGTTPPSLLILDEPTNHLDIDSIEAVEAGLRAYDGALLVVSHDETFLQAIGISRRLEL